MSLLDGFDASTIQDTDFGSSYAPMPEGVYNVLIESAEEKYTRDNSGQYIKLVFAVLDEDFRKRKIFRNLNMANKNEQTVAMARKELAQICQTLGLTKPQLHDLCNRPMLADVRIRKEKDGKQDNVINRYAPVGSFPAGTGLKLDPEVTGKVSAPVVQSTGPAIPPWKK